MSNSGRHNRNRFSDFEPEVNDSTIDESWEKIRYFLPQEKKRRGFFWLFRGKASRVALAALALAASAGAYVLLNSPEQRTAGAEKKPPALFSNQNEVLLKEAVQPGSRRSSPGQPSAVKELTPAPAAGAANNSQGRVSSEKVQMTLKRRTGHASSSPAPAVSSAGEAKEAMQAHVQKEEQLTGHSGGNHTEQLPLQHPDSAGSYPMVVAPPAEAEALSYSRLAPLITVFPFSAPDLSVGIVPIPRSTVPVKGFCNALLLELFGGMGPAYAHLGITGLTTSSQQWEPGLGLGLIYKFRDRIQLNGHVVVAANRPELYSEAIRNKVIARQPIMSSIAPSTPVDTNILYIHVVSALRIRSERTVNFQLGAGYSFYKRARLELDVFCQAALRSSAYTVGVENSRGADTLSYLHNAVSGPLPNEISDEQGYSETIRIRSLNLVSGLTASYAFTGRLALVFKPMFSWQLKSDRLTSRETTFSFRQHSLFLNLGLRVRLSR